MNKSDLNESDIKTLRSLPMMACMEAWDQAEKASGKSFIKMVRSLALADLFYLLVRVCNRIDLVHPWKFERVREVEASPYGHLDLWAREHCKTSIITFGLTIWDILKNPEITIGIFSHTRPIAKAFLRQIMREFEGNQLLQQAFPDVLWKDPREAPKWSEDDGIIVKRKSNPNEATVEAWGLVDAQPTSKHFKRLHYDDIVVQASVTTPEMIDKTMTSLEQSYNLGTVDGVRSFAGTRWHFSDAYSTIKKRGTAQPREHPGRIGGTEDGDSVLWSEEIHEQKRRDMGPYTYACQILLNPRADALQGFRREWLRKYRNMPSVAKMNGYILVDAASSKKKGSDYTSMWVIGLNVDKNRYALDIVRDRLNLKERGDRLFALHRKWSAAGLKIQQVRYEKYGLMSDIEHYISRMEDENYRFKITEVAGQTSKVDRIRRLIPIFEQSRMWLPETWNVTDWQRSTVDLVHAFIEEEYMGFPVAVHDDMMDSLARMEEPDFKLVWPQEEKKEVTVEHDYTGDQSSAWMGA